MKDTAAPTRRQGAYLTAGRDKSSGLFTDVRIAPGHQEGRNSAVRCGLSCVIEKSPGPDLMLVRTIVSSSSDFCGLAGAVRRQSIIRPQLAGVRCVSAAGTRSRKLVRYVP